MRRLTFFAASIVSVLVIAYGSWLSSAESGASGNGGEGHGTGQTGKPGEAPKR
ncbi:hypothetical protein [Streptomyces sp. SID13031]|uniref:hypothetical protein n=1 Tax=Streptomyces sp. SID13031 TaxID=2706046 RepID=UPI0013C91FF8|nr:hypothetical protein [Streptomyces sp. SID13031]NEA30267.1 hypothetical protein [Streptomyces sp. SID13031]